MEFGIITADNERLVINFSKFAEFFMSPAGGSRRGGFLRKISSAFTDRTVSIELQSTMTMTPLAANGVMARRNQL